MATGQKQSQFGSVQFGNIKRLDSVAAAVIPGGPEAGDEGVRERVGKSPAEAEMKLPARSLPRARKVHDALFGPPILLIAKGRELLWLLLRPGLPITPNPTLTFINTIGPGKKIINTRFFLLVAVEET